MAKIPAFQFYPADWVQDTNAMTLAAKGAWIDILCTLWRAETRGRQSLTSGGWARVIRSSKEEALAAITELSTLKICDIVTDSNGHITLISRRMVSEESEREMSRNRAKRFRSNASVTQEYGKVTLLEKKEKAPLEEKEKENLPDPLKKEKEKLPPKEKEENSTEGMASPLSQGGNGTPPARTPIQKLVEVWKLVLRVPRGDYKTWDKVHFARCAKSADLLLSLFEGNLEIAVDCMQGVYGRMVKADRACTLETIVKHAHVWKQENGKAEG